jgi:putative addiction module component (TIGR02574 family)
MNPTAEALFVEAMKLPLPDREDLASLLLGIVEKLSPDGSIDQEWDEEIARRIEEIRSGAVKTIPADEVFRRLRAIKEDA